MKISVSGVVGSGKSSVSKLLAKRLGFEYFSIGKIMRMMAKKRGISLMELSKLSESDDSVDKELDEIQIEIGKTRDNFVIDSRLGFHFIPDSVKVFLDVSIDEAAKRVFYDKRRDEKYKSLEEAKKSVVERINSERKRYLNYYGIKFEDKENFDIVVDTSKKSINEVASEILEKLKYFR